MKPVSFELGGKNAAIVFADCNFEETVSGLSDAAFLIQGKSVCVRSAFMSSAIFSIRFVDALKEKAESLHAGWPTDAKTYLGPLISAQHREKVLSYFRLAQEEGATVVTGGGVPEFGDARDHGFYVQPTIYTGLLESARCVKEEILGRCVILLHSIRKKKRSAWRMIRSMDWRRRFGRANLKRGHRVAQQMNVGITWVNCWFLRDLRTPFGGVGLSGIGREGGMHSLNFYSELNNICIRL